MLGSRLPGGFFDEDCVHIPGKKRWWYGLSKLGTSLMDWVKQGFHSRLSSFQTVGNPSMDHLSLIVETKGQLFRSL